MRKSSDVTKCDWFYFVFVDLSKSQSVDTGKEKENVCKWWELFENFKVFLSSLGVL